MGNFWQKLAGPDGIDSCSLLSLLSWPSAPESAPSFLSLSWDRAPQELLAPLRCHVTKVVTPPPSWTGGEPQGQAYG